MVQVLLLFCVNFVLVGVVGGMGLEVILDFIQKLFKMVKEVGDLKFDQDYMQVIMMNIFNLIKDCIVYFNSFMGDCNNVDEWCVYLFKNDFNNFYYGLFVVVQVCVVVGVYFFIFFCNIFYVYYGVLLEKLKVLLLYIVEVIMWVLWKQNLDLDKLVGLLVISGIIDSKFYQIMVMWMEQYGCFCIKWVLFFVVF